MKFTDLFLYLIFLRFSPFLLFSLIFNRASIMSELGGERPTLRHSSTYGNISTRTTGQNDTKNYSGTNFRSENYENSALLGKSFSAFPDSAREGTERFPILGTMDSTFSDLCKY